MIRSRVDPAKAHLGDPLPMPMQEKLKQAFAQRPVGTSPVPAAPAASQAASPGAEPAGLFYRGADGWVYARNAGTRESAAVADIRRRHAEKRAATPAPEIQEFAHEPAANDNDADEEDEIFRHYMGRNAEERNPTESPLLAKVEDVQDVHLTQAPAATGETSPGQINDADIDRAPAQDDAHRHDAARRRVEARAEKMNVQKPRLVDDSNGRKQCILNGGGCLFTMTDNPDADDSEPLHEVAIFSAVGELDHLIDEAGIEQGVDPDLIRAIIYLETTHGQYDKFFAWFGGNKSILPMNLNVNYWGDAFGTRDQLQDPKANITAGAKMLRALQNNLPAGAPVSHIASLYNNHRTETVNDYGARVARLYMEKPWKQGRGLEE